MIIRLLDIENGRVIPTEHCYTIAVLKDIMDNNPEERYLKIYAYLFYMTCPDPEKNPFFHMPEDEKEETILREVRADFSPEEDGIIKALKFCEKAYDTPTKRAYIGIKIAMDNIANYMATTKITHGRDGSIQGIRQMAKDFQDIRDSFKGAFSDLMDEQKSQLKGGGDSAYDQR